MVILKKNTRGGLKIKKLTLFFFAWGFLSALLCGLVSGIFTAFYLTVPGVIFGCVILFLRGKELRKYSIFIFLISFFSIAYSFLYDSLIGEYFSIWEFIHICGPSGLLGYGVILFINAKNYNKNTYDEDSLINMMKITVIAGIIVFGFGIWWIIIIIYYYLRFLYWPFFWILSCLSSVSSLGIGMFSFLLIYNMKKILPVIISKNNKTLFPLFCYVLCKRRIGMLLICLGLLCIGYQTGLFPVFGL